MSRATSRASRSADTVHTSSGFGASACENSRARSAPRLSSMLSTAAFKPGHENSLRLATQYASIVPW